MSEQVKTNCTIRTAGAPAPVEAAVTAPVTAPTSANERYPDGEPHMGWRRSELERWCEDAGLVGAGHATSKGDILALIEGA